jgi:hypothetical protein
MFVQSGCARGLSILVGVALGLAAGLAPASAEGADTGDIFGFSDGTDIGEKGDRSFEFDTVTGFGKRAGAYRSLSATAAVKGTLSDEVAVGLGVGFARAFAKNVPGLDNANGGGVQGLSGEVKYRVLDRAAHGVGLTLIAQPAWSRLDGEAARFNEATVALKAAFDRELMKDKLFGAVNFGYAPAWTWPRGDAPMERGSTFGLSTAISAQVRDGVFFGLEARYEHAASGLFFNESQGRAIFVGPTFYAKVGKDAFIAGGWGRQVAGRASGVPRALDLDNFERNVVRARFAVAF